MKKSLFSLAVGNAFMAIATLFLFSTIGADSAKAALGGYTITATSGSQINTAGGVTLHTGCPGCGHYTNYAYGVTTIGFNFTFEGVTYTQFQQYTSGVISLGPGTLTNNYNNVIGNPNVPVIAPFWDQLAVSGGCGYLTPRIAYIRLGTAPNRSLVCSWEHIERALYGENMINVQARIYENGNIEFWYGAMNEGYQNWGSYSTTASIGLAVNSLNFLSLTPTSGGGVPSRSTTTANNSINAASITISPGTLWTFRGIPIVELGVTPQPHNYNFGSLGTGQSATFGVVVTNVGNNSNGIARLSIKSVTITGDPDYTIVSAPVSSDSIDVGQSRSIVVRFAPIIDGVRNATITISSNGLDSATQTFSFTGVGLAPLISVDTNILFKNKFVKLGQSMTGRIKIFSTNTPTLSITGFQFVGLDSTEYSISQYPSSMSIPGGSVDSVLITYRATKEGRHTATLNILNNSINNPVLPITLWGTGILPHIVVTPNPLIFDSVSIGTDSCKKIRIYNPGSDSLLILSNAMVSNDGDFTYTGLTGADSIIPPDKFKDISVCFKPKAKGSRIARIRLTTNIPKTFEVPSRDTAGQFLIDIRGTGVPFGVISQKIGDIEGGGWTDEAIIGTQVCTSDTVWNNGGADLLVTSMTLSGSSAANYAVSGKTVPFTIKANSYVVLTICCTPTTQGPNTAQLNLSGTSSEKPLSSIATLSVKGLLVCATATPNPLFNSDLVLEGTDSTICVDVTNCGDVPTSYTASLPVTATDYTISGTNPTAVIAPGDKASFCIKFTPTTMGSAATTLTITPSTSELAPLAIPVNAIGACANTVALAVTATPIGKGGHQPFSISITNNGNYTWTPGTAVITPNDNIFTIDAPGFTPLAPNQTAQVTGTFNPTENSKTYSANITFTGAEPACAAAVTIPLTGQSDASGISSKSEDAGFILGQNHPNPFAASTEFAYTTPTEAVVTLSLHDVTGKLVRTISSGNVSSGEHTVFFTANDLASGTYILMLESGSVKLVRQIVINR